MVYSVCVNSRYTLRPRAGNLRSASPDGIRNHCHVWNVWLSMKLSLRGGFVKTLSITQERSRKGAVCNCTVELKFNYSWESHICSICSELLPSMSTTLATRPLHQESLLTSADWLLLRPHFSKAGGGTQPQRCRSMPGRHISKTTATTHTDGMTVCAGSTTAPHHSASSPLAHADCDNHVHGYSKPAAGFFLPSAWTSGLCFWKLLIYILRCIFT